MTSNNPSGPGNPLHDLFKRQRAMEALFKYARGPGFQLQQQLKALEGPLAHYRSLEKTGVLAQVEALRNSGMLGTLLASNMPNSVSIAAQRARMSPTWMLALQSTAWGVAQKNHGILNTQQLLAESAGADVLKLVKTFNANRSIIETMTAASKWTEQFRLLGERFAPGLAGLKLAAERARMVDMSILRASAEATARSSVVIAAEHVLEAHGLIEAIGQADSHAQSITLFAQLLAVVEAIFSGFQENTVRELKGVGAFRLIELLLMAFAIWHMIVPAEMAAAEKAAFAEVTDKIEMVEEKLGKIMAADEAADEYYIADLPRAELKRDVAIRREPMPRAQILMHGLKGTQFAVKDSREKWRLVVYRDLLTNQLAEGWVYASAVEVLDDPAL